MKVVIKNHGSPGNFAFEADPVDSPGSPMVGRGATMLEALGNFLICYQKEFGVEFVVDPSAQWAEDKRREEALRQR